MAKDKKSEKVEIVNILLPQKGGVNSHETPERVAHSLIDMPLGLWTYPMLYQISNKRFRLLNHNNKEFKIGGPQGKKGNFNENSSVSVEQSKNIKQFPYLKELIPTELLPIIKRLESYFSKSVRQVLKENPKCAEDLFIFLDAEIEIFINPGKGILIPEVENSRHALLRGLLNDCAPFSSILILLSLYRLGFRDDYSMKWLIDRIIKKIPSSSVRQSAADYYCNKMGIARKDFRERDNAVLSELATFFIENIKRRKWIIRLTETMITDQVVNYLKSIAIGHLKDKAKAIHTKRKLLSSYDERKLKNGTGYDSIPEETDNGREDPSIPENFGYALECLKDAIQKSSNRKDAINIRMKILPLMLEYGGISHTEIARRIHKDEKTVRRHIQKIRKIGKQIPIIKELLYS